MDLVDFGSDGAPGTTRTCDPLIRSQVLYPAELRVRERQFKDSSLKFQVDEPKQFQVSSLKFQVLFSINEVMRPILAK